MRTHNDSGKLLLIDEIGFEPFMFRELAQRMAWGYLAQRMYPPAVSGPMLMLLPLRTDPYVY